jgi:hypothetical protein
MTWADNSLGTVERATPGEDYEPVPSPEVVIFTASNAIECATLEILRDGDFNEPDEMFTIIATLLGSRQVNISSANVVIVDDDGESCM